MNAVLAEPESRRNAQMSGDESIVKQVIELRSDVRHIQSDVTEIKAELRATNQRIDALAERVDGRFESFAVTVGQRYQKVEGQIASLKDALWSAKLWALGLYAAQSGTMLLVMAHGFKWI